MQFYLDFFRLPDIFLSEGHVYCADGGWRMIRRSRVLSMVLLGLCAVVIAGSVRAAEPEQELVIVKYGKVTVKSSLPDAKIYVDDVYKGSAERVVENVMVGDHTISCRTETQSVSGTFAVKRDELLKLEARFNEGKLVALIEHEKIEKVEKIEKAEKIEVEKKPKVEAPKAEKPKKPAAEIKKADHKNPEEERRATHLSILKVYFESIDTQEAHVTHKLNPKVIGNYTENIGQSGTYYRTKKDILLCEAGPCVQQWSSSMSYTDEQGAVDTFSITWKQTVFNGITPAGTSKRELLFCLNKACQNMEDAKTTDNPQAAEVGRYHITWSRSSLVVRRSDIMKEVVAAGGMVEAY